MNTKTLMLMLSMTLTGATQVRAANSTSFDAAAFDAARVACESETGAPARDSGTRPTQAQHQAMQACLQAKGFSPPPDRRGPPPDIEAVKACAEAKGVTLPDPSSGERPTKEQLDSIADCFPGGQVPPPPGAGQQAGGQQRSSRGVR